MNIIVIGATQGLGLALTKKLLSEGHKVAAGVVERHTPPSLAELLKDYQDNLLVFRSDVTNEEEIQEGAQICREYFQTADALVNVAGIITPGDRVNLIHQCDMSDLYKTFDVNAFGAIRVAKHFYPLIKKGGKLFTVTSEGVGIMNCGTWIPCYALSKTVATKVSGMFNSAISDVDFFAVHPGRMNTEMGRTTAEIEPEESAEGFYKLITGETPISRKNWYINYKGEPMET